MNASQPSNRDIFRPTTSHETEKPAIGIIATEANGDSIVRCVFRAKQQGYPVLVTYDRGLAPEVISLVRQLGARIINTSNAVDQSSTAVLSKSAQQAGFVGLIVHHNTNEYIDYKRSISAIRKTDSYSIEAIPKSSNQRFRTIVGIPAYNEEQSIETVVSQARQHVDEVLVVDDGSDDETSKRADEAGAIVFEHSRNRGYGATLKTIFREANRRGTDHLVVLDGDGQHDPDDIPKLLARQRNSDAELVIGNRFMGDSNLPIYRSIGLRTVNFLTNVSMGIFRSGSRINDTQSGFRAYSAEMIRSLAADDSIGAGMDASTDILHHAHTHGYGVEEVETTISYDVDNTSSKNPIIHGYILVRNILNLLTRQKPIQVLGGPGFLSALVGFGFVYWTIGNYIQSGTFPIGIALIASAFILIGLFSCFTAIILHSINTHYIEN